MSIRANEKDGVVLSRTIHCDDCGIMAPIAAPPDMEPVALLNVRVQGWLATAKEQKCPKCRALPK